MKYIAIAVMLLICFSYLGKRYFPSEGDQSELIEKFTTVALSLKGYSDINGSIKSKYKSKNSQFSWRVAIYPWVDSNRFYADYNKEEPFDSASNLEVARRAPIGNEKGGLLLDPGTQFRVRRDFGAQENGWTSFVLVTNKEDDSFDFKTAISDGAQNTIIMVYYPESQIFWPEPMDLIVDEAGYKNHHFARWLASENKVALFADGSLRRIHRDTSESEIIVLCTRAGREKADASKHELLTKLELMH